MKFVPESANRKDWPRLVAAAVNGLSNLVSGLRTELNAEVAKTTDTIEQITFTPIAEPTSPVEGQTYMDSTSHVLRTYDGTIWRNHW